MTDVSLLVTIYEISVCAPLFLQEKYHRNYPLRRLLHPNVITSILRCLMSPNYTFSFPFWNFLSHHSGETLLPDHIFGASSKHFYVFQCVGVWMTFFLNALQILDIVRCKVVFDIIIICLFLEMYSLANNNNLIN